MALGNQRGTFQFITFSAYHCPVQNQGISWCMCSGNLLPGAFTYQGHISGIPPVLQNIKLQLSPSLPVPGTKPYIFADHLGQGIAPPEEQHSSVT